MTCQQQLHSVFSVFGQCCSPHPKDQSKPICEYLPRGRKAISFQLLLGQQMATVRPVIIQKGYVMLCAWGGGISLVEHAHRQVAECLSSPRRVAFCIFKASLALWRGQAPGRHRSRLRPHRPPGPPGSQMQALAIQTTSDHCQTTSACCPSCVKHQSVMLMRACHPPNVNIPGTRI